MSEKIYERKGNNPQAMAKVRLEESETKVTFRYQSDDFCPNCRTPMTEIGRYHGHPELECPNCGHQEER